MNLNPSTHMSTIFSGIHEDYQLPYYDLVPLRPLYRRDEEGGVWSETTAQCAQLVAELRGKNSHCSALQLILPLTLLLWHFSDQPQFSQYMTFRTGTCGTDDNSRPR